jgi:predicted lipoprotein with Yx(FWY)xxD motif
MQHRYTRALSSTIALASFLSLGAGVAGAMSASASPATQSSLSTHIAAKSPTVHTATAVVSGKTETILVNSVGLPLYYNRGDTAKRSFISGELAGLWPPLLSSKPTAFGIQGRLTALKVPAGHQVNYNGHFLYTFIQDSPGHVTGQGVSNFYVATPRLKLITSASKSTSTAPTSSQGGYAY